MFCRRLVYSLDIYLLGWVGVFFIIIIFIICFVYFFFFYQLQLRQERVGGGFCSSGDNRRLCLCSHGDKIQGAFWLPSNLLPTPGSQVKVGQRERGAFVSQVLQLLLLIKQRALVPCHLPKPKEDLVGVKGESRGCTAAAASQHPALAIRLFCFILALPQPCWVTRGQPYASDSLAAGGKK